MMTRHFSMAQSSCRIASRITAEEYAGRRARLVQSVRKVAGQSDRDLVLLLKGSKRYYIAPDVPGSYRQCSHFRYLSGVTIPGCYYLIHSPKRGGPPRPILFMNKRSDFEELWEGALPGESSLELTAGFEELLPTRKINEVITKMASSGASLFFESDDWAGTEVVAARSQYGAYHCLKNHIDELRFVKSPMEIQSMRDVCTIGAQVVASTIAGCRGFDNEASIGGLLEFESRRRGAEMLSYPPVIAAGARANTIHYLDANGAIEKGDCVLMDAGVDLNGYVSDITRCFPISGKFSSAQRTLYDALLYVHEQLLEYAHKSEKIRLSNLYSRMMELICSAILEVGLLPQSTDSQQLLRAAESLCPHHVSHYLGMDVHDCTTISRDIDVPHGTVFTIEPGLYVPKDPQFPEEFHGIGLRIEDDVVATAEGIEVLSDGVPRAASEIEYLMRSQ
uniref:AMP_N domain-containing protein n=1 Tax=Haemonchus contortus TaxID=6289 RepID=A0A7I4XV85_HAECO